METLAEEWMRSLMIPSIHAVLLLLLLLLLLLSSIEVSVVAASGRVVVVLKGTPTGVVFVF